MSDESKIKNRVKSAIKRTRGRPIKNTMPEPIPDTPENIAKAVLSTPPKKLSEWKYLREK